MSARAGPPAHVDSLLSCDLMASTAAMSVWSKVVVILWRWPGWSLQLVRRRKWDVAAELEELDWRHECGLDVWGERTAAPARPQPPSPPPASSAPTPGTHRGVAVAAAAAARKKHSLSGDDGEDEGEWSLGGVVVDDLSRDLTASWRAQLAGAHIDVMAILTAIGVILVVVRTLVSASLVDRVVSVGIGASAFSLVVAFLLGVTGGSARSLEGRQGGAGSNRRGLSGVAYDVFVLSCFLVSTLPFLLPWLLVYFFPREFLLVGTAFTLTGQGISELSSLAKAAARRRAASSVSSTGSSASGSVLGPAPSQHQQLNQQMPPRPGVGPGGENIPPSTRKGELMAYLVSPAGRGWGAAFICIETVTVGLAAALSLAWEMGLYWQLGDARRDPRVMFALVGLGTLFTTAFLQAYWLTYALGGLWLHQPHWSFFQPLRGGWRFATLQALAWSLYALCMSLSMLKLRPVLRVALDSSSELSSSWVGSAVAAAEGIASKANSAIANLNVVPDQWRGDPLRELGAAILDAGEELARGVLGRAGLLERPGLVAVLYVLTDALLVTSLTQYKHPQDTKSGVSTAAAAAARQQQSQSRRKERDSDGGDADGGEASRALGPVEDALTALLLSAVLFVGVKPELAIALSGAVIRKSLGGDPALAAAVFAVLIAAYLPSYRGKPSLTGWRRLGAGGFVNDLVERYFSFKVVRIGGAEEWGLGQAQRRFVMAYHPHGLLPGAASYGKNTAAWAQALPGLRPATLSASITHLVPLLRDINQWTGSLEVSKRGYWAGLDRFKAVLLVPGGQQEMVLPSTEEQEAVLTRHAGFVRLALQRAARCPDEELMLVPMFDFGGRKCIVNAPFPIALQKYFVARLRTNVAFFPLGRFSLPCVPSPRRTTLVVGRPIRVPSLRTADGRPAQPTERQVALLHRFYFSRLRALFYEHRDAHGDGYERAELVYYPAVDDISEDDFDREWASAQQERRAFTDAEESVFVREVDEALWELPKMELLIVCFVVVFSLSLPLLWRPAVQVN